MEGADQWLVFYTLIAYFVTKGNITLNKSSAKPLGKIKLGLLGRMNVWIESSEITGQIWFP